MGQPTFLERLKAWIGGIGYDLLLWSLGMTAEEYIDRVGGEEYQSGFEKCRALVAKEIALFDIEPTTARVTLPYVKNAILKIVRSLPDQRTDEEDEQSA